MQIQRQGLYLRLICRCAIPSDQVYRLYGVFASKRENMGVLVPEGDSFSLDRRIPAKRFGEETPRFEVSSGQQVLPGEFIPICPEEPFFYIDRLKNAFLQKENGKIGIRTEKHPEAV